MRRGKCQCSVFKELYTAFTLKQVEEETRLWMEQHKKECSFCRGWSKSVDENRLGDEALKDLALKL